MSAPILTLRYCDIISAGTGTVLSVICATAYCFALQRTNIGTEDLFGNQDVLAGHRAVWQQVHPDDLVKFFRSWTSNHLLNFPSQHCACVGAFREVCLVISHGVDHDCGRFLDRSHGAQVVESMFRFFEHRPLVPPILVLVMMNLFPPLLSYVTWYPCSLTQDSDNMLAIPL